MNKLIFIAVLVIIIVCCFSAAQASISPADSLAMAKKHLNFAIQHKKTGEYKEALNQYEKSLAFNFRSSEAHISFGISLVILQSRLNAPFLLIMLYNP